MAKRPFHEKKVEYDGVDVYRYLLVCRRCVNFMPNARGHRGTCIAHDKQIGGGSLSCDEFKCDDEIELVLASGVRDGEFERITLRGLDYYLSRDEVDALLKMLDDA